MHYKNIHNRTAGWNSVQILIILVLVVAVGGFGMLVSRRLLLDNARVMGKNLVTSYAIDEDRALNEYKSVISMGMAYLEDMSDRNAEADTMERWAQDFFNKSSRLLDLGAGNIHAVIKGQLVDSGGSGGRPSDPSGLYWYRQAVEGEGAVIFTDTYQNIGQSRMVVTVAAADPDTGNAIAIDVPVSHFQSRHSVQELPDGGSYYVCDSTGTLLFHNTPFTATDEDLQAYVSGLFARVRAGELDGRENSIIGLQGLQRGVYYQDTENGWLCILTVPYNTLLQGVQDILIWYGMAFVLFVAAGLVFWLRSRSLSRTARRTAETVQVLSNMYYAIYRVNVETGAYEVTKASQRVFQKLGDRPGDYGDLLQVILSSLDQQTGEEFSQTFSLENIRQLADQQVRDFGGEFLRQTEEGCRWISVRLLTDPARIPNEAVLCFRDVEKEKEEQQKQVYLLKGALDTAEQSEKSQKQFFSIMSHDMRTPLNIIIGMTGLALQPGCTREKMLDCIAKISAASQQLLALINDILEISRLEQGNISMEIKSFNLQNSMESWCAPFQAQAQTGGKEFRLSMDIKDSIIKGDPARLGQIINNLVSNAMKFTNPGDTISVSLRQMTEGRRNNYLFLVKDTGIGMSAEYLPKLFAPYEREMRFGTKETMGTGLGMPIVKNLVNRMGGQISVSSTPGKGTAFSITLPFDVGEAPAPEPAAGEPHEEVQLAGRRILLAEDNYLNMEIAAELLQMRGASVTPAENGRLAVDAFQKAPPYFFDAILMDMQMPEMDGCQAAQSIRALDRPDAQSIPIIALTANAFAEDINRTAQAGMNAHLAKPINIEQLCGALEKFMAKQKPGQAETLTEKE